VLFAEVLDQAPSSGIQKGLFVVAEAVQVVEHRIAAHIFGLGVLAGRRGVLTRGQKGAVAHGLAQDAAGDHAALNAALGVRGVAEGRKERREQDDPYEREAGT
jgi:hypothetical protein